MSNLSKIEQAGFKLYLGNDGRLVVVPSSELSPDQREFVRANKQKLIEELKQNARDLTQIEKWIRDKGETDQKTIDEILERCQRLPEARSYYLKRAVEVRR